MAWVVNRAACVSLWKHRGQCASLFVCMAVNVSAAAVSVFPLSLQFTLSRTLHSGAVRGSLTCLGCAHPATTGWQRVLGECACQATRLAHAGRRLRGVCGLQEADNGRLGALGITLGYPGRLDVLGRYHVRRTRRGLLREACLRVGQQLQLLGVAAGCRCMASQRCASRPMPCLYSEWHLSGSFAAIPAALQGSRLQAWYVCFQKSCGWVLLLHDRALLSCALLLHGRVAGARCCWVQADQSQVCALLELVCVLEWSCRQLFSGFHAPSHTELG